jgi:hypothetical protein
MGGRGVALIDTLAADWGVDDLPDGQGRLVPAPTR